MRGQAVTGYYGKVSTHGDFVGRRLPAHLVQAWDRWLEECMRLSREKLGPAWLERYLSSPMWRFAIAPGVLGPEGLGGVMMPSVDRVGRYFPLMVGAAGMPPLLEGLYGDVAWYDAIEDLVRESLEPAFTLERLDHAPEPARAAAAPAIETGAWRSPLEGQSMWWSEGGPFVDASIFVCQGMPRVPAFSSMLDRGWTAPG